MLVAKCPPQVGSINSNAVLLQTQDHPNITMRPTKTQKAHKTKDLYETRVLNKSRMSNQT